MVEKGKGKAKEVTMLPRGGEKQKKKKMVAKVVEVPGLSGQWSGFNPEPFLERLDRLTRAVKEMTRQMRRVADATRSVARGNEQLTASLETFLEECCFFTVPWDEDEEDSEAEVDPEEEVKQEVQGLQEEQENPGGAVLEHMVQSRFWK